MTEAERKELEQLRKEKAERDRLDVAIYSIENRLTMKSFWWREERQINVRIDEAPRTEIPREALGKFLDDVKAYLPEQPKPGPLSALMASGSNLKDRFGG